MCKPKLPKGYKTCINKLKIYKLYIYIFKKKMYGPIMYRKR